jgi:hypothetical protein|tara:strand:+ start:70 stop:474 length:405 start_codon:yes stop_codon:yes gene_type:complete
MSDIDNFDNEYKELVQNIKHIEVGLKTLIIILEYVLDIVERVVNIKGNKKKTLAILLITKLIDDSNLEYHDRQNCITMIETGLVGDTIDLVVNAHNGKLDFDSVVETSRKCCFFAFLKLMLERREKRNKIKVGK